MNEIADKAYVIFRSPIVIGWPLTLVRDVLSYERSLSFDISKNNGVLVCIVLLKKRLFLSSDG